MIYFTVESNSQKVNYIHNMPFDEKWGLKKSKEELLKTGFFADELPQQEEREGFVAELKFDGENLHYDYIEFTPEPSEMEQLKQKVEQQEQAIAELTALVSMSMTK